MMSENVAGATVQPEAGAKASPVGMLVWGGAAAVAAGVATWFALAYAPIEGTEGIAQKIMYVHVPSAWAMYIAFAVNLVATIVFLAKGSRRADRVALAGAEVGVLFCTLVLLTGPIWGKAIWKIWWTWDARLTMTAVVWFLYIGYLVTRAMTSNESQGARYAAVVAIIAFLMLPVLHQAVEWWGGQHPEQKTNRKGALLPEMRTTLFVSGLCFAVICSFLIGLRTRVEKHRDERMATRMAAEEGP